MQKLYRTVKLDSVKAKTAGEYFGTLQDSVTDMWREHLKTSKYSAHMALDEYYTEMPEKVDGFIEAYIAVSGSKIVDYKCNFQAKNLTPLEYLKLLKAFLEEGREEYCAGHSELESDLDDILGLIDSTIYKLRELHEGVMDLRDLVAEELYIALYDTLQESLIVEAKNSYLLEISAEHRMQPTDMQVIMAELNKIFGKTNIYSYDGDLSDDDYLQYIVTATPAAMKKIEDGVNGFDCRFCAYDAENDERID